MIIKEPVVIDISHYEPIENYAALSPRPAMMIAKATEGATFKDDWFLRHMAGAAQIGAVRGAYHFHRKAVSAAAQVKNFCDTVRPIISKRDVIILDVEEGGETAAQLMAWYEGVMAQFPDNPYWIYSRKNLLDPIAMVLGIFSQRAMEARIERENLLSAIQMTLAERTFFRTKLQASWTAGYPANPDLYDSPPASYIPDQTKWPPVKVWQYTDKGRLAGLAENVDLNWMDKAYLASLGGAVEPPPSNQDTVTEPFQGVRRITGMRYGRQFSLVIADPKQVRYEVRHVTGGDQRDIATNIAKQTGAQFVWNGGDWDKYFYPYLPKDLAVSHGVTRVPRKTARPSLIFQKDGTPSMNHVNISGQWNVTTGVRYIVQNGALPSYLSGTEVQYTDRTARSIEGLDGNGHVMRLTIDGENLTTVRYGVTLKEAALLMVEYGCVTAFDTGGGGDTCEVMNGKLMNVPEDVSNGVHVQRNVPEFLVLYAQENETMADYYEYTATGNRAIRTGAAVTFPRIPSNSDLLNGTKAKGGATPADRVTLASDLFYNGQKVGMAGDVWVKVYDNNGKPVDGWTALKHMGELQLTERLIAVVEPPPPSGNEPFNITVTVNVEGYYDNSATITMLPK